MVTNSRHILSHQQHFIHMLIHVLTTTTGVISQQPSLIAAALMCVYPCLTEWDVCTLNQLTWDVHTTIQCYIFVDQNTTLQYCWRDSSSQKCSIHGRIIFAIPVHAYVSLCKWSAVTSSHHDNMGQDYFLSLLLMYNCYQWLFIVDEYMYIKNKTKLDVN